MLVSGVQWNFVSTNTVNTNPGQWKPVFSNSGYSSNLFFPIVFLTIIFFLPFLSEKKWFEKPVSTDKANNL